ncbi:MAG: DUF2341 domain-containing protein [Verrucomicrobia bacterium]|nr:DUF2341 domain-containing protein [Verrucomicrobiota bacterium]
MTRKLTIRAIVYFAMLASASAQYQGWQHSGSLCALTTPEGANLPATASEENFPMLVRLNKDWFDFSQAKANGDDLRFASAAGASLAYQIEEWDAANGTASIWVRIPVIKGNARQEIKLYWGKADAAAESKGPAVFNESNGYVVAMHMSDPANPAKDDVGTLTPKNVGTTACPAPIGNGLHFDGKSGIECGENPAKFPTGSNPHSTEAWIRPLGGNHRIIMWGYGTQPLGPIQLMYSNPPFRFWTDCWASEASVSGASPVTMGQWYHVVHTYQKGEGRLYVNGVLAGTTTGGTPMNIVTPEPMWIGVEYGRYFLGCFKGDMDEVRVSKVTRSADWVKMEYENQKPLQTLVGPLVQTGNAFAVSPASITVEEGKSITVTAHAGGAQKIYWIVKKDGSESIAAVDQYSYTLDAGRVVGDTSYSLRLKAVYANEVKTKDIPVTVKETIPEPVLALKAPSNWNGRDTIEVAPEIRNLPAMTAKGAGELRYQWSVSGGAVSKEVAPGKLILKRSQYTGPITVKAVIDNGGVATIATVSVQVTEPKNDPWVQRIPELDEKPEDGQFYARDDNNEGTLYYNGTLDQAAGEVFLKVYADDKLIKTETAKPAADHSYSLTAKLKAGLIKYKVEFVTKSGGSEKLVQTINNLVCGDAYLIDGQSNALALDTSDQSPNETSEWIRSYGGPGGRGDCNDWVRDRFANGKRENLWCSPFWRGPDKAALGWWGMELAKKLLASQKLPICIIQAAEGGTRIDEHMPNASDPVDLKTLYGHMLWRLKNARLTHGIRAVLWHQGEADQGSDGPDNGYDSAVYQQYFLDLSAAWKQDMPNIRHYYVFQIWPNGCSQGGGHGDLLREKQRTLSRLYSNMDVMSTLGIKPGGGCHYPLTGWSEFARLMQPLIERDFYGSKVPEPITAPDLKQVYYASSAKDAIILEFDQPVIWLDSLAGQFYLDDAKDMVAKGSVNGNVITLQLKAPATAGKITYLKELNWNQNDLIFGKNGIAALTFCDVPVLPEKPRFK